MVLTQNKEGLTQGEVELELGAIQDHDFFLHDFFLWRFLWHDIDSVTGENYSADLLSVAKLGEKYLAETNLDHCLFSCRLCFWRMFSHRL